MATYSLNTLEQYDERYDLTKFSNPIPSRYLYFDIVDSEFLSALKKIKKFETYVVTSEYGRPDLLSERLYGLGETQFWWILMLLNEMRLPKDLVKGKIIKYPSRSQLEEIYLSLGNKKLRLNEKRNEDKDDLVEIRRLR